MSPGHFVFPIAVADSGADQLAADHAGQAHCLHQAGKGFAGDVQPFAPQLPLDPAHAVNAELLLEYGALPVRTHHYAKPEPTAWSAQPFWLCEHELNARSPLPTPTNKGLTSRI